jgi:DNA-binding response OmpR family regulator
MLARSETCPCCGQALPSELANRPLVDLNSNTVAYRGAGAKVTCQQAEMLWVLASAFRRVVGYEFLYGRLWGMGEPNHARTVIHVQVRKLRQPLRQLGLAIENVHGRGYRLIETKE